MEDGKRRRTGSVHRVERIFERSRLEEQLWTLAYERVVPLGWQTVRPAPHRDPSAGVAERGWGQELQAIGARCR